MFLDRMSLDELDENTEVFPLLSKEEEDRMNNSQLPDELAILPTRNTVLFPGVVVPITAGRDQSIKLLKEIYKTPNKILGVVSQRKTDVENPTYEDLFEIGTVAKIIKLLKMPDGSTTVIIQGLRRFKIDEFTTSEPYFKAKVQPVKEKLSEKDKKEFSAVVDSIRDLSIRIIELSPNIPTEASFTLKNIESQSFLIHFISSNMDISAEEKQKLLEENNLLKRALKTLQLLDLELQKLELKDNIRQKVQTDLDKQQRDYFLHQQLKTIQEELGENNYEVDVEEFKQKAEKKKWTEKTKEHFEKELLKFQRMNPQVAEYSIQRNYLELFLELPWGELSKDQFNLKKAQKVLDADHFGLEKVKERIIEYLAVLKLKNNLKSPILCLYGPPGVGKTSLGKSIAKAVGRKYVRMSLGGLHDESEIRGHRKTYIGAMPGRILQSMKKAGTSNPVFVLDEIDKLGRGAQGDPSSALLEVLDPEQNHDFYDNFLEIGYDLSNVMFIATANSLAEIQPALRDRMEIIPISGYTTEEKVKITQKYLIPKQVENHGLDKKDLKINKSEIEYIVEGFTRESGVRGLEKNIAKLARNIAKKKVMEEEILPIKKEEVDKVLGIARLRNEYEKIDVPGVVTGLAWTSVGGAILYIESILSKGKGNLSITGNLGKVMKESSTIAMQYIKSNADYFGIDPKLFEENNVHIHVPEGATPKDGPSAGVTMLTSLVSVFTKRKVRSKIAMTGEITLRGKVLPVGGIKEKVLAAKRAKVTQILLSEENRKDVEEIPENHLKGVSFHYVTDMKSVIDWALVK